MSKMKDLLEAYEKASNRQNELMAIRNGEAKGIEKRELNEDENAEFDLIQEQIDGLKISMNREEKFDKAAKENANVHFSNVSQDQMKSEKKAQKDYSILRAINLMANQKPLDGIEREMQDEAVREARDQGRTVEGVSMPSFMMHVPTSQEIRTDITVGTAATAGNLVATDLHSFIPALQPRLKAVELGARVMGGLVGNLDLPIGNALSSTAWEGETDTTAESNPTTTKLSLTANRLSAFIDVSKQFLIQSSHGPEQWLRGELSGATARAVDSAIINGSGASNQPEGILNKTGIGSVAGGTNGLAPTMANIIELETLIAVANADVENMAYLTTPAIRGFLKNLALGANDSGFIWDGNGSMLNGYNAQVSTQCPSTLTKGTSSGVCHAIIMGNWQECIVANWGTVDIIVNPYTKAKEGLVELVVNSYWDVGIPRAGSFAAMVDALTS